MRPKAIMRRLMILTALLLTSCAASPIPEGYSGPIATIRDSAFSESNSRAQFFFLSEINGNRVDNVLGKTRAANRGAGFSLRTLEFSRDLPAKSTLLTLTGQVSYGAPMQEILNASTVYSVTRRITFAPESNKMYVVRGTLTAETREVWLEEAEGGKRVGQDADAAEAK
jgi:hypothetical protein